MAFGASANSSEAQTSVSVVIPVLNEASTIGALVHFAFQSAMVREVVVVDDGSIDGSPEIAAAAGARVIMSTLLGKGASMEDGLREARSDLIVYLDGDLQGLRAGMIEALVQPLAEDKADFVKARFRRAAGRVTILTAKPLLRTYFPELNVLEQPLGGIIAVRRALLQKLTFENDYGVDVGLVIDAFLSGARIREADIGWIEHRSQSLEKLGDMATQVARSVLERAARAGRLRSSFIQEAKENERLSSLSLDGVFERVPNTGKVALFDMDGVILNGRFIVQLAETVGRSTDLAALLDNYTIRSGERMKQIAAVFAGVRREAFESAARDIPLMPGAAETIVGLRKEGYRVGIVTDSYHCAAEMVRRRVFADFCFAHVMRFKNGRASGRVNLCPAMFHPHGCVAHDHCKLNVLVHLQERLGVGFRQILAVGDGENDVCMLKAAGQSIAFQPKSRKVAAAARHRVRALGDILRLVADPVPRTWRQRRFMEDQSCDEGEAKLDEN